MINSCFKRTLLRCSLSPSFTTVLYVYIHVVALMYSFLRVLQKKKWIIFVEYQNGGRAVVPIRTFTERETFFFLDRSADTEHFACTVSPKDAPITYGFLLLQIGTSMCSFALKTEQINFNYRVGFQVMK